MTLFHPWTSATAKTTFRKQTGIKVQHESTIRAVGMGNRVVSQGRVSLIM